MSEAYQERTGLDRFAKFDPSVSRIRISKPHRPCWQCAYIYLLAKGDYESARLVRARNDEESEGRCHDCGKTAPLRDYDADAGDPPQAVHYEICEECYEERTDK